MDTLILLYALAGSNYIPEGCFVVAWTVFILKTATTIFEKIIKEKNRRRSDFYDSFNFKNR